MKKLISIILTLSLLICVGCLSVSNKNNKLTDEQWIEDINFLNQNIKSSHPIPFRYVSEDIWNESVTSLLHDIPKLSDIEITIRISQLLALLQDGHTNINIPYSISTLSNSTYDDVIFFPLVYKWFDNELRVFYCDSKYKDILGYELLAINSIDIDTILNKIYTTIQADNLQNKKYLIQEQLSTYEILKFFNIVDNNSTIFTFKDDLGNIVEKEIAVEKFSNIKFVDLISIIKSAPKTYNNPDEFTDYYWYKLFEEDNILYFQYNSCIGKDSWVPDENNKDSYPEFFPFVDELVNEFNSSSFDKFIIDLRYNTGGSLGVTNNLVTKLKNKTDISSKKVFVLISKQTYSAGAISVIDIKNYIDATVIGEETGGSTNPTTVVSSGYFTLPNSKIKIKCASSYLNKVPGQNGGVLPDIYLEESYSDFVNGIDTYYEYIKNNTFK